MLTHQRASPQRLYEGTVLDKSQREGSSVDGPGEAGDSDSAAKWSARPAVTFPEPVDRAAAIGDPSTVCDDGVASDADALCPPAP